MAIVEVQNVPVNILKRCLSDNTLTHGVLIGQTDPASTADVTVLTCAVCKGEDDSSVLSSVAEIQANLPGGVCICGMFYVSDNEAGEDMVEWELRKHQVLQDALPEDKLVCHIQAGCQTINKDMFYSCTQDGITKADVTFVDNAYLTESVIARVTCHLPVSFTFSQKTEEWQDSLRRECQTTVEDLQSSSTIFHLQNSSVVLGSSYCCGVEDSAKCQELYDCIDQEGEVIKKRKKKEPLGTLHFELYSDLTSKSSDSRLPSCTPVISHSLENFQTVNLTFPLDTVTIVGPDSTVDYLVEQMKSSLTSQILAMEACMCQYSKGENFDTPVPYHFQPQSLQTLLTVIYPRSLQEEELEAQRRDMHEKFCLPKDRPLFRRGNQFIFQEERVAGGYLVNVHQGVPPSKVKDGSQYIVSGLYTYHHYMQDRFDDNKWGCAYRSLQTLVSWFRFQGYTEAPIPSHREIQQALVDVGDKDSKFVGSQKWIGSMEVSFCLDHLIGITSKIMNVNSGAELATKGRELAVHFSTQGTPIMIGGGVLAHTILGVDFNEVTGDVNFLILDPHYTGAEDLKVVQDKGWCGWKGPEFWDQTAHYNLCMPQRPNVI